MLEFRQPRAGEMRRFLRAADLPFGTVYSDFEIERVREYLDPSRMLWALDGDDVVGTAGSFAFELSLPGGRLAPAAGVTLVGVMPSHRRQGILTRFMRAQLEDVRSRGEPLAILWASEGAIYGRYGYGVATWSCTLDVERERTRLRGDPAPAGRVRIVPLEEAARVLPALYERRRREMPGMCSRDELWWEVWVLGDAEEDRRGAGPLFCAVLELDGEPAGYALHRKRESWEGGMPAGALEVDEVLALSPLAERELWRYLFGIDLVERIRYWRAPVDLPLLLQLAEPRRLRLRIADGLWLRLVDVERALSPRAYAVEEALTIELRDAFCPWNEGRYRLEAGPHGASVERTNAGADVALDVADLGSLYLGGVGARALVRACRLEERGRGAVDRAERLFAWPQAPWCPGIF